MEHTVLNPMLRDTLHDLRTTLHEAQRSRPPEWQNTSSALTNYNEAPSWNIIPRGAFSSHPVITRPHPRALFHQRIQTNFDLLNETLLTAHCSNKRLMERKDRHIQANKMELKRLRARLDTSRRMNGSLMSVVQGHTPSNGKLSFRKSLCDKGTQTLVTEPLACSVHSWSSCAPTAEDQHFLEMYEQQVKMMDEQHRRFLHSALATVKSLHGVLLEADNHTTTTAHDDSQRSDCNLFSRTETRSQNLESEFNGEATVNVQVELMKQLQVLRYQLDRLLWKLKDLQSERLQPSNSVKYVEVEKCDQRPNDAAAVVGELLHTVDDYLYGTKLQELSKSSFNQLDHSSLLILVFHILKGISSVKKTIQQSATNKINQLKQHLDGCNKKPLQSEVRQFLQEWKTELRTSSSKRTHSIGIIHQTQNYVEREKQVTALLLNHPCRAPLRMESTVHTRNVVHFSCTQQLVLTNVVQLCEYSTAHPVVKHTSTTEVHRSSAPIQCYFTRSHRTALIQYPKLIYHPHTNPWNTKSSAERQHLSIIKEDATRLSSSTPSRGGLLKLQNTHRILPFFPTRSSSGRSQSLDDVEFHEFLPPENKEYIDHVSLILPCSYVTPLQRAEPMKPQTLRCQAPKRNATPSLISFKESQWIMETLQPFVKKYFKALLRPNEASEVMKPLSGKKSTSPGRRQLGVLLHDLRNTNQCPFAVKLLLYVCESHVRYCDGKKQRRDKQTPNLFLESPKPILDHKLADFRVTSDHKKSTEPPSTFPHPRRTPVNVSNSLGDSNKGLAAIQRSKDLVVQVKKSKESLHYKNLLEECHNYDCTENLSNFYANVNNIFYLKAMISKLMEANKNMQVKLKEIVTVNAQLMNQIQLVDEFSNQINVAVCQINERINQVQEEMVVIEGNVNYCRGTFERVFL